jgi:hypothetical protein
MLSNPHIHPLTAFEQSGMFSDPQAAYAMGEENYEEQKAELAKSNSPKKDDKSPDNKQGGDKPE